jgi:hypothetical protein
MEEAMKATFVAFSLAAVSIATPAAASPAAIIGVLAVATAVGVSASQQPYEDWEYTEKYGWVGGPREEVTAVDIPIRPQPGTSQAVISVCRDALTTHAQRYDLASLEVVSGGKQSRSNGSIVAPLDVRAIYKINGVHEVKRSKVRCVIDRVGRVIATI